MNQEQSAKCVLKLNTPVLNALFPEGTEARVQLVNAALTEVTKAYIKSALSDSVQAHLKTLADQVKKESDIGGVIARYFSTSGGWNSVASVKPDTQLTKALASAVENAFSDQFYKMMNDQIEKLTNEYTTRLESRVEYAVNQHLNRLTTEAIQKRVDAAVNAARATL